MATAKWSDKPCVMCDTPKANEETVLLREPSQEFQGAVCPKHLMHLLKKWKKDEPEAA